MVSAKNFSVCNFLVSSLDGKDNKELCFECVEWVECLLVTLCRCVLFVGLDGSKRTGLLRSGLGIDD